MYASKVLSLVALGVGVKLGLLRVQDVHNIDKEL
jgi:hypothetical protein